MSESFMKILSGPAPGYRNAVGEQNENFCKKLFKSTHIIVHSEKIHLPKNKPAIKYTEARSAKREKDVLLEQYSIKNIQ